MRRTTPWVDGLHSFGRSFFSPLYFGTCHLQPHTKGISGDGSLWHLRLFKSANSRCRTLLVLLQVRRHLTLRSSGHPPARPVWPPFHFGPQTRLAGWLPLNSNVRPHRRLRSDTCATCLSR